MATAPFSRKYHAPNKQQVLRTELIAAGLKLFQQRGFENTTAIEIAEAAGTSRRTFFRYFKSKDDVVFDWLDEQGDFINAQLTALAPGKLPLAAMRDALLKLAQHLDGDSARAVLLTGIIFDTPSLNRRYHAEAALRESELATLLLVGRGSSADAFALRVQIAAGTTAFVVALRAWAADNHGKPLRSWVSAAFRAIVKGSAELPPELPN